MTKIIQLGNIVEEKNFANPQTGRVYSIYGLAPTLNTCGGGQREPMILVDGAEKMNNESIIVASRGRNPENPADRTPGTHVEQRLEPNSEGICNTLTTVQKDNMLLESCDTEIIKIKQATKDGYIECDLGGVFDTAYPGSATRRGRVQEGGQVSPTLTATGSDGICKAERSGKRFRIRKLTPRECWRLMDFSDLDFFSAMLLDRKRAMQLLEKYRGRENGIEIMREAEKHQKLSNSALYEIAGNSIVRSCLVGIFGQMVRNRRA